MKKKERIEIKLEPLKMETIIVKIKGTTPLLMDKFPDETKKAILDKQTGIAKSNKKKTRDIQQEINDAVHRLPNGLIGFPVSGFKKGMIEATSFVGDKFFSKKLVCGAIRITNSVNGLIPIKYKKQEILEHSIGHNIKYNPMFIGWQCELNICFDCNNISRTDILTLLNYAGTYTGVGAWRPKGKDGGSGEYGCYEVSGK